MRRSPRVMLAWFAALVVALTTARVVGGDLATLHRRAASLGPQVSVIVATHDLALGQTITAGDIRREPRYRSQARAGHPELVGGSRPGRDRAGAARRDAVRRPRRTGRAHGARRRRAARKRRARHAEGRLPAGARIGRRRARRVRPDGGGGRRSGRRRGRRRERRASSRSTTHRPPATATPRTPA